MCEPVRPCAVAAAIAALAVLTVLFPIPVVPAQANPLPAYFGVGFHMQSSNPLDCSVDPVAQCSQISQYCPDIGTLAVDIYLYLLDESGPDYPVSQVDQELHWDGAWSFVQFQSCVGGSPDVGPLGDGVRIDLSLPQPIVVTADPVRIGRLYLLAESSGRMNTWTVVRADGEACFPLPAAAGQPCYPIVSCEDWFPLCYMSFHPPALQLTVEQGGQTEGLLDAWVAASCTTSFVDDQPWMGLSVAYLQPDRRRIGVSINAEGLSVGVHEGLIVAVTEATHTCAAVQLTVTPPTSGLPEGERETRLSTWSSIKQTYR
jgi:hypothetical protein